MQKICPYCGRAGELGSSCQGCGYVLQASDQGIPQTGSASVRSETQTVIHTTIIQSAPPQMSHTSQYRQPVSPPPIIHTSTPPTVHTSTPVQHTNTVGNRQNPFTTLILRIFACMMTIPILLAGVGGLLVAFDFYKKDIRMGHATALFGILFIMIGFMIINLILPWSKKAKFAKILNYLLALDIILLIIAIFSI